MRSRFIQTEFIQILTIERLAVWILFILLFVMAMRIPLDTDVWWHLRSGDFMLNEKSLLQEDIFSHTRYGEEWINHSWGGQLVLTLFFRASGGEMGNIHSGLFGLALYTALFGTAGMFFIYRMAAMRGGNIYSQAFIMILGAATAAVFWSPRPQMISFFLSTVILYLLYLYKWQKRDYLYAIPLLMILWVNMHGGFAIGFIFLIGFIAGEIAALISGYLRPDSESEPDSGSKSIESGLRKLALITLLSFLALAINPYGLRMMTYPFETAGLQTLNLFIQEWKAPDFKNPQTWPFIVMLLSMLILAGRTRLPLDWTDISLVTGTAFMAFFAARNIAVFAVVATPVLSHRLAVFLDEHHWQLRPMKTVKGRQLALNWLLLILILFAGLIKITADFLPKNVEKIQNEYLPVEAIDYLKAHPELREGNIFNFYNWGGLLMFEIPETPVFVDGRTDLYGDEFLKKYFRTYLGAEDWADILVEYDIQTVFIEKESALTTLLRENDSWNPVYEDDQVAIFEKIAE